MAAAIELEKHSSQWQQLYLDEVAAIVKLAGRNLFSAIEHIGSTSVPKLVAKPTIDICIGVYQLDHPRTQELITQLLRLDYVYLPELEAHIPKRRYLQKLDSKGIHLFHIHIVVHQERLWNEYINFRNSLINNPQLAVEYEQLKLNLASKFKSDRVAYTAGKANFIQGVLSSK